MQDIYSILQWWLVFLILGIIFYPLTSLLFKNFFDKGYLFSKVLGIGLISYTALTLNIFKILPFNIVSLFFILWIFFLFNFWIFKRKTSNFGIAASWKIFIFEEIFFLAGLFFWSYIRAHEPSINGLEKFMDFGFLNSILRSVYQPATDMWFPPYPINYYYFGHYTTAVLTKFSMLPSFITYNLMIATIFSFTFCLAFSLVLNLTLKISSAVKSLITGILGGGILAFGGNLHTFYSLFKPYSSDNPVPIWQLPFSPLTFPNNYWYPNATRFIPFTIHEFPIYSFVVSDLHGHVVDIMYVLLTIALIYIYFIRKNTDKFLLILIALFLSIMYMTNAWDGAIYLMLASLVVFVKNSKFLKIKKLKIKKIFIPANFKVSNLKNFFIDSSKRVLLLVFFFVLFSLPFSLNFKPFASQIGVLCAPSFLVSMGHLGPFLFEANHCQKSQWWELLTLYGFFFFFIISFIIFILKSKKIKITKEDLYILMLILISTILIIVPEFIYLKDIYPAHYRANTMFKLVYQAFIMLSVVSAYVILRIMSARRNFFFYILSLLFLIVIFTYPYFAIRSYYGDLKTYKGMDGINYLKERYPQDYQGINWLNKNIKGRPVVLEAQGDSYTDYERISANTGLPTVLGWTVHEWLWRGSYDVPAPRIADVKNIYESSDIETTVNLLKKYSVEYVYVGNLEREKYANLNESKFALLGNVVFEADNTRIYKLKI